MELGGGGGWWGSTSEDCRPLVSSCNFAMPQRARRRNFGHLFFSLALLPKTGHGLLILEVPRSHTMMYHSRQDSSGRVISPSQRPPPDKTQHPQQKDIHVAGGIRTHNLSRRAVADPCLRRRGHWDRPSCT